MNNITYAVSVDVNNPIIPYNVYVASVLDSNVRYLEITLYENGNIITLSNTATATASLVTDNVLVNDSVNCTIQDNIITVPLEDLQRHGNLDVQVTVTEGTKVLAIPFPIQVRVTPNIAEEAQINENSLGSYAEVVHEITEARGTYTTLHDAITAKLSAAPGAVDTENLADESVTVEKVADDLAAVINAKEVKSNKKTTLTGNESSNDFYPTTKAVADALLGINAGSVGYDDSETYQAGSVGAELQEQNRQLSDIEENQIPELKNAFDQSTAATNSDIGKAHSPKTVVDGQVTEWRYVEVGGSGITNELRSALITYFSHVTGTFDDEHGQLYIDGVLNALKILTSITAVFNGVNADVGTDAEDLDITVTGHYSDETSSVLSGWTITGVVEEGTNTFTITYGSLTCTVTVTGVVPSTGVIYNLPAPLVSAGDNTVDTGLKLHDDYWYKNNSWTIYLDAYWDNDTFYALDNSWTHNGNPNTAFQLGSGTYLTASYITTKGDGHARMQIGNHFVFTIVYRTLATKNGRSRLALSHDATDGSGLYMYGEGKTANYSDVSALTRTYFQPEHIPDSDNTLVLGAINTNGTPVPSFWGTIYQFTLFDHAKDITTLEEWVSEV